MNSGLNYLCTAVIRIMQIQLYKDFGHIVSSNHVSATEKESQKIGRSHIWKVMNQIGGI